MKKLLVLALIVLVCSYEDENDYREFEEYVRTYDKHYESIEEYMARYMVFKENLEIIRENRRNEEMTWTEGINEFSDLTEQEFRKYYANLDFDALSKLNIEPYGYIFERNAPSEWNWVSKGAVGPVKNQGQCGSCWAFGTINNIEGLWHKKKGQLVLLSEQMLVDCDSTNGGCNGGNMGRAFTWIKNNGGIMKQSDYGYTAKKGSCKKNPSKYVSGLKLSGYKQISTDENQIKEAVYSIGPLTVGVNASPLHRYRGGVINLSTSQCSPRGLNHAVNIVGYGHDKSTGLDYWLVRNSWGASWGEHGYFRIVRGKGSCGINVYVTTAILA